jgi:hypothetical protein
VGPTCYYHPTSSLPSAISPHRAAALGRTTGMSGERRQADGGAKPTGLSGATAGGVAAPDAGGAAEPSGGRQPRCQQGVAPSSCPCAAATRRQPARQLPLPLSRHRSSHPCFSRPRCRRLRHGVRRGPRAAGAEAEGESSDASSAAGGGVELPSACGCDSAATGSPASSSPSRAGTAGHRGLLLLVLRGGGGGGGVGGAGEGAPRAGRRPPREAAPRLRPRRWRGRRAGARGGVRGHGAARPTPTNWSSRGRGAGSCTTVSSSHALVPSHFFLTQNVPSHFAASSPATCQ